MIKASELSVTMGRHRLLDGVDLTIEPGQWLGLIGPNGAGKTTLLRALLGQVPSEGAIRIGEHDHPNRRQRAQLMAFVPQRPVLPPAMTVFEYVLLGRTPHIPYLRSESATDVAIASSALEVLELADYLDRQLHTLSGGEQQRAILARALAQEAPILLLDEPTSALDIGHQISVLSLVDDLRRKRDLTVLTAIHDLTLAAQFCDQLLLLSRGKVVVSGIATEVLTQGNIGTHFDALVEILKDSDRVRGVLPQRPATREEIETPIPPRVSAP